MLLPPVLALGVIAFHAAQLAWLRQALRARAVLGRSAPVLLSLLFLLYPMVTNVAFEAFPCHTFEEGAWLRADVSLECGTPAHA